MKKYVILFFSISMLTLSCKKDKKQEEVQLPPISDLFEAYYEDGLKLNPLMATFAGDNRYNDQLPNFITKAYQDKERMPFTEPEQVIANFNAIHEKMKLHLEKLFDLVPETAFEVRRTEAFREASARLVVDNGIHTKGWTREKAIQYSLDHEAEPESSIISEIERYMAMTGQALSYKIGQLKIRELRAKAEEKLGNAFDIREFHNTILESGALPLKIVKEKVNRWIASKE